MAFARTSLRVNDFDKTKEFYEKAFNFREVHRREFEQYGFNLVYLREPNSPHELELVHTFSHDDEEETYAIGKAHGNLVFVVDDVKEINKKHKDMGYDVKEVSFEEDYVLAYYIIYDPDGRSIEVLEEHDR